MLDQITPLILTYNEAPNIERTLERLRWAKSIIIIDSFSHDETLDIVKKFPQVTVFQRKFTTFAEQCNYGLTKIESEWVLSLDADYYLTDELIQEIQTLSTSSMINGYQARFKYCVFGKPLRKTLLPPRKVLYRRAFATYKDDGHAHQVIVSGTIGLLSGFLFHDDRKPLSRWLRSQDRYLAIEANKLLTTPWQELSWSDRIRKQKLLSPFMILIYCLILHGGILDGWRGIYYAFQRMLAEILLSINLIEVEQSRQRE